MKEGGGDAGQRGVQGKEAREEGGKYFRAIICIIRGNPLSCRQAYGVTIDLDGRPV